MKKWLGLFLVVSILLLTGSFIVAAQDSTTYVFEGKEIFQTTEEYGSFKEAVGIPEVTIREVFVLSSEPPIVVDYQIEASRGLDFPYGERGFLPSSLLFGLLFAFGSVGTLFSGGLLVHQIVARDQSGT